MNNKLTRKNEIKTFVLYLLNYIRHSMHYDDLFNLVSESGYVGYFDFAEIFHILLTDKNIEENISEKTETEEKNKLYAITDRGKIIAENLEYLLPTIAKNKGIVAATRYLELKKLAADISYCLEDENDGCRFTCSIANNPAISDNSGTGMYASSENFHLSVFIKEKATADKMLKTFSERPNSIYRGILAMLSGDANFIF